LQVLITKIAESYNPVYGQNRKTGSTGVALRSRLINGFFSPVLAPLLLNRWLICLFLVFCTAQLLLVYTGLTGWQCPIYETLGVICPGCGMTTAMAMLLKGHWQLAIQTHAFAPLILMGLMLLPVAIVLPASRLKKLALGIKRVEQKSGIIAILLLSMVSYWLLRIFDFI